MTAQIKELLHFQRDDKGKFIPKLVKVLDINYKETDTEIYIIPMNRGELLRYFARFDENNDMWINADDWIILTKVIYPKFSKTDLNIMKRSEQDTYVRTVLHYSGVKFSKTKEVELDDFALRLKEIKLQKQEAKLIYFLNERGYSLTSTENNLNLLTTPEVDIIISEFNKANKPAKKKGKNK